MPKINDDNNQAKHDTLSEMRILTNALTGKLKVLRALDDDIASSGWGDLHDQLWSMEKRIERMHQAIDRATEVLPTPVIRLKGIDHSDPRQGSCQI